MINTDKVRYALRERLLNAGIITGDNDFHGENLPSLTISNQPFWIDEYWGGHTSRPWSAMRRRIMLCLMRYDIYVPKGTGTLMLSEKQSAIELEFDILDDTRSNVLADGITVTVYRISVSEDVEDKNWRIRPVTLFLRCTAHI